MPRVHQTARKSTGPPPPKKQATKKALPQNSGQAIGDVKQSDVIKQNMMHQIVKILEIPNNGRNVLGQNININNRLLFIPEQLTNNDEFDKNKQQQQSQQSLSTAALQEKQRQQLQQVSAQQHQIQQSVPAAPPPKQLQQAFPQPQLQQSLLAVPPQQQKQPALSSHKQQQQQIYIIELEFNGQSLSKYCCVLCQCIFISKDIEPHLKGIRHHNNVMKKAKKMTSDIKSRLHKAVIHKPNEMVKFYFNKNLIACYCTACNHVHSNLDIFNKHFEYCCKQTKTMKIANCEICRLDFNSNNDYNLHLESSNHKNLVLQNMVNECVKIIKHTSDEIVKEEMKLSQHNESATKSLDVQKKRKIEQETINPEIFEKLKKIKGVLRSKQSENVINLNIVCFDKPTKSLFDKLYNTFANGSNLQKQNQLCIDSANDSFFVINKENPQLKCCISFSLDFKQQVNDVVKVEVKNEPIDEDVIIIDSFNVPSKKQRLK